MCPKLASSTVPAPLDKSLFCFFSLLVDRWRVRSRILTSHLLLMPLLERLRNVDSGDVGAGGVQGDGIDGIVTRQWPNQSGLLEKSTCAAPKVAQVEKMSKLIMF